MRSRRRSCKDEALMITSKIKTHNTIYTHLQIPSNNRALLHQKMGKPDTVMPVFKPCATPMQWVAKIDNPSVSNKEGAHLYGDARISRQTHFLIH